jgi:glycolate oxidase iron-sulfur subunit
MQTNFTLAQLADPDVATSEKILRSCVHCGFCTATCPTYVLLGDELDSPRGRIYLIKDMLEESKAATDEVALHIDRCLSCLACMTTCPSGVDYMHLVDHARVHIENTYRRPVLDRAVRAALAAILPHPQRFRAAVAAAFFGRPFAGLFRRVPGLKRLAAMIDLAPRRLPARSAADRPGIFPAVGTRRGRVALLRGCAQSVLDPGINDAAIRLLTRKGVEVVLAEGEACCGALVHHLGKRDAAHAAARNNIVVWTREIDGAGLDAILVTTSGCGTAVKDYGFMFRIEPEWAARAARISGLAKDISEYLESLDLGEGDAPALAVAYHAACSLQHGQQIRTAPKALLARAGFDVREPAESHLCCGSAGTYNMLQPEISEQLRDRKVGNIEATGAVVVAAGNIGCLTQIAETSALPVVHTVELLDWAYGGPKPEQLAAL